MTKPSLFQQLMIASVMANPNGRVDVMGKQSRSVIKGALKNMKTDGDVERLQAAAAKRARRALRNARGVR